MSSYKVVIQGRGAKDAAEKLIESTEVKGELLPSSSHIEGTRDLNFQAIVEFFKAIQPIASTASAIAGLAYTIWKWRKDIGDKRVVKLEREVDGEVQTLEVYPTTTQREIEQFLLHKDQEKEENDETSQS